MTKAQNRVFNRLMNKQVNKRDCMIVDFTEHTVTIHLRFPGLYLTYDDAGYLTDTETEVQRKAAGKRLASAGPRMANREMGT